MITVEYWPDADAWKQKVQSTDDGIDAITLSIHCPMVFTQVPTQHALDWITAALRRAPIPCVVATSRLWTLDLGALQSQLSTEHQGKRLRGHVSLLPEALVEHRVLGNMSTFLPQVRFYIRPEAEPQPLDEPPPSEICDSLARAREDHPDHARTAFIMMRFARTPAHESIVETLRAVLREFGLTGVRADDKQYHSQLWYNVQTYMHLADFGIAVLERLEEEEFNPNVSLEVGYMLARRKPVLLLKDRTLKIVQTDLVGHIYESFDTQNPRETIPPRVRKWLRDNQLAPST